MRRVLALCAALLAAAPAQAHRHRHQYDDAAAAGGFDDYLLSLSIAPAFCATPAHAQKQECRDLTQAAFAATPLTVHGLWPNRAHVSVNQQPHDCGGPPLGPLPAPVQADLQRYMPAGPELAAYEWRKHGTCSGLAPDVYFATVARLARDANAVIGGAMRAQGALGHDLRIADLLSAVAAHDPALAAAIVVDCGTPRGGGNPVVQEIRVTLSRDFAPIPAASVGLGQNSGCRGGAGLVPDAGDAAGR